MASLIFGEVLGGAHGGHAGGGPAHGGHGGAGAHGGGSGGDLPGMSPASPTILATFLTAFGGLGMIFSRLNATDSAWLNLPLAAIGAVAIAAVVFAVFNKVFRSTQGSSEGHVRGLIGISATVITPISPGGVGEIAYIQGGTRYTAPAKAESAEPIASGCTVCIIRVTPTAFYVAWI